MLLTRLKLIILKSVAAEQKLRDYVGFCGFIFEISLVL